MMSLAEIRLKQNPILTSLLLGLGQGTFIAESVFPRLPQSLSSVMLARVGSERLKKYNLRRAPGTKTARINISYEGRVYSLDQDSVEVPIPRELIRESEESRRLQVGNYLDISRIAMVTANDILGLAYEIDVAGKATDTASYADGHVATLSGGAKWSADTGMPVTDITTAAELIRKAIGKRPNTLTLSADAFIAIKSNKEVRGYLPSTQMGPSTVEQLKTIFNVTNINIGDAVWKDESDVGQDVWGNNAILSYVPKIGANTGDISLAEPGHGFTNVMEGSPFAETPYFSNEDKSWIYGATYERRPNVAYPEAAFLFKNPK